MAARVVVSLLTTQASPSSQEAAVCHSLALLPLFTAYGSRYSTLRQKHHACSLAIG